MKNRNAEDGQGTQRAAAEPGFEASTIAGGGTSGGGASGGGASGGRASRAGVSEKVFPPPGFVDRYGAAALLGIGTATLSLWVRQGRLPYAGVLAMGPNGVRCRIYAVAELERARSAMKATETERAQLPDGLVSMEGAAAFFGVHIGTITGWQRDGRLPRGTWIARPGLGRIYTFAVADLERARAAMEAEAARPAAPEGFVELHAAAKALGVHVGTVYKWEKQGRLPAGRTTPIPGTSARTKVYPIREVERLREELRAAAANFPPPGWIDMKEAAGRAKVSTLVWKRWIADGRVESGQWFSRPTMGRCKLFRVEEVERLVEEAGRDHFFFLEADGKGDYRPPVGFVDRAGAAAILGVAESTIKHWQSDGRITCGRWARMPVGEGGGRRVYPVEELGRLAEELSKIGQPYVDPEDPTVVRVPIMSWSRTRCEAIIDAADLPLIEGMRWNLAQRSGERWDGDAVVLRSAPSGRQTPLRRILLGLEGRPGNICHRNGDPLDCRRANLVVRDRTHTNASARKRRHGYGGRPCTSRFKGVCWVEKSGKWFARIQKEGVARRLGSFDSEVAAAEAYDEAARELFGEHARLNFPDGVGAYLVSEMAAMGRADEGDAEVEEPFLEHPDPPDSLARAA